MQDLERLNSLIDKAAAKFDHNDAKLAAALDTTPQTLSNWRHGHKPCGIERQKQMCELAGIDHAPHVLAAAVEKTGDAGAIHLLQQLKVQSILIMRAIANSAGGLAA